MNIADWLRHESQFWPHLGPKLVEAADEIERLSALLECALMEHEGQYGRYKTDYLPKHWTHQARAALSPHQDGSAS